VAAPRTIVDERLIDVLPGPFGTIVRSPIDRRQALGPGI